MNGRARRPGEGAVAYQSRSGGGGGGGGGRTKRRPNAGARNKHPVPFLVQNMFVSERRWIKVVAHVIRRLWDMDGTPQNFAAAAAARPRRPSTTAAATGPSPKPSAAAAAASPFGLDFQQPPWRPAGGGKRREGGPFSGNHRGGGGGAGLDHTESFLTGLTGAAESRSDFAATGEWEPAAAASRTTLDDDDDDDDHNRVEEEEGEEDFEFDGREDGGGGGGEDGALLRAWEEEGESWVGAGRSLAWGPADEDDSERGGRGGLSFDAAPPLPRGLGAQRNQRLPGRLHGRRGGGGGGGADENWKEGTRPAGMWEVTPPPHVMALRRGSRQAGGRDGAGRRNGGGGGGGGGGPAYLRGVQSRIRPQLDAHKKRLRKVGCCCLPFFVRAGLVSLFFFERLWFEPVAVFCVLLAVRVSAGMACFPTILPTAATPL